MFFFVTTAFIEVKGGSILVSNICGTANEHCLRMAHTSICGCLRVHL